jgi:hypothetical protein
MVVEIPSRFSKLSYEDWCDFCVHQHSTTCEFCTNRKGYCAINGIDSELKTLTVKEVLEFLSKPCLRCEHLEVSFSEKGIHIKTEEREYCNFIERKGDEI